MNELFRKSIKSNLGRDPKAELIGAYDGLDVDGIGSSRLATPPCPFELLLRGWAFTILSQESKTDQRGKLSISGSYETLTQGLERVSPLSNLVKSRLHQIVRDLKAAHLLREEIPPKRSQRKDGGKERAVKRRKGRPSSGMEVVVSNIFEFSIYPWFLWPDSRLIGSHVGQAVEFFRLVAVGAEKVYESVSAKSQKSMCEHIFSFHLACLEERHPEIRFQSKGILEPKSFRARILKHLLVELGASKMKVAVFNKLIGNAIRQQETRSSTPPSL